ncbi:MAG: ribosome-associated translation inhibitor RaiA [Planctomycetota bacterium]|nr:ribosome-associated translation inhibitor RaiA [Planctomycetota bacterium]
MRIEVVGKHLELTPAMTQQADAKCQKLLKYYDRIQQIDVTLEQVTRGGDYAVELRADVELHEDFIAKATHKDLYAALDLAVDKLERQLTDFKEKLKNGRR